MDKYIRVKNCNCISDATIEIVEKSLNIKYGSNGTGKSTISEAIYAQANNETDRLKDFKPYGSNDNSQPTVDNPYFHVVKVFNEDYVNSYLFQGDEFLDDSFQVFLKSDKCDSLAAQIERMLEELQDLINNIDAIHNLRTFLPQYTAAVKASDGTVSRRGGVAEFVNGNGGGFNHYSELKAYKPFYSRDLPSVAKWAKWRNDGIKQMCGNDCPFCTNILPSSIRSQNEIISKVFKNSALSVANAVLEYVQQAVDQGYILPDAVDVLESYIGDNTKADELYAELQMLAKETDYLYKKIEKICMFKPMNVTHAQLVNLEQSLSELVIEERQLQSFYATDLIKKLIYHVSDKINALKGKTGQQKLSFKYIIVDEYQDISRQRFDLTKALSEVTDAKIIAVGDDWQSIYAFSGSDITLFTKFSEKMGYAKMLKIVKTYRNSQEVIDIAGNFIQKNSEQIRKRLLSPKNITDPVIIYTYDSTAKGRKGDRRSGSNYAVAHAVETALTQLIMYKKQEGRQPGTILLLGRYAFDGDHLEKSGLFEFVRGGSKIKSVKYPKLDITFMTAHSSKGLGYDDVIIVNGKNETYGFPSKIEDDPVLAFVIKGDRSIDYAEERRLFYVAMTRTKNRVFFVAPEQNPSEFLLELKKDYKNVVLHGNWNEEKPQSIAKKSCPLCGYPMQLKYKRAYGLRLYICTNEPEICGFMTNDYRAGKLCIQKCDKCRDGYLVVKSSKENGYFLGCTNYKTNGTGCNKSIGMKYYYDQMGYRMEIVTESPVAISRIEKENPVKRVAVTQVSTDDYVEIEKTTAASVRYKRWILNNVVDTVLRALQDVSKVRYYGVTMLTDILRGANSKRILDNGLEMVPEYGMLKEIPRETIQNIIEWLINEHYILKTKEKYPVLHSTYEGLHYSESLTKTKLEELKAYLEKDEA